MTTKTEEIKVRVEPRIKYLLLQMADEQDLDLSDIVRRGLREFIAQQNQPEPRRHAA